MGHFTTPSALPLLQAEPGLPPNRPRIKVTDWGLSRFGEVGRTNVVSGVMHADTFHMCSLTSCSKLLMAGLAETLLKDSDKHNVIFAKSLSIKCVGGCLLTHA